uniref:DUF6589 domain-containing protein n=1 Tax=Amphimedon queenslandica TaxID=400682 RepID=A0A1X7VWE6_AMPQE
MARWKFLMVIFRKTGHRNYAKEAVSLLLEYHFTALERKAAQVGDSRFITTKGREGCNMACDLFIEHLNRRLKGMIRQMGSNIQPHSIAKAAKSLDIVNDICRKFEIEVKGQI